MEFVLYLPQMRMTFQRIVEAAKVAEAAGFTGIAGMDHLAPPMADDHPCFDAMLTNTWAAAHTERLKVSSLVLCDAFYHPAVLAKQCVSLDHASQGRFELGVGWGSWADDFSRFGVAPDAPRDRVARLRETLEVLQLLWSGESVDYEGRFHRLRGAKQAPRPLGRIPIVIGGGGPKTLALVRDFADWWNLDVRYKDKFGTAELDDLRSQTGSARVSLQQMIALVPPGGDRAAITETTLRRFGQSGPVIGEAAELKDYFARLAERGVERIYAWFCDFAPTSTLEAFADVIRTTAKVGEPTRAA